MNKLIWVFNRLSVMGASEICHRLVELANIYYAKSPIKNAAKKSFNHNCDFLDEKKLTAYQSFVTDLTWKNIDLDKQSLLENQYQTQSIEWKFEDSNSWFLCPVSGFDWPSCFFQNIDHRSGGDRGDIRILWESSRLQQLVAFAYIANTDPANSNTAIQCYLTQFNSWFKNNPPYKGPHYVSVMECALRIISICFASSLIKKKITDERYWQKQSQLVTSHAEIIMERLSLHSSSGNHTITEAVGLVFAAEFYSNHPRAEKWGKLGEELFLEEFIRQTNPDGSGIEQTAWYLKFIYELSVVVLPLLSEEGKTRLKARVAAVNNFLAEIFIGNTLLDYGDSDGGWAVSRYIDFLKPNTSNNVYSVDFPNTGLIKIKRGKAVVFFDYGNLGMSPSYGHGHADCLSVNLLYNGAYVFGDRGTYTYNGSEKLREYFRSTSAHNTVVINHQDQSVQSSKFMWKNDIESELLWFANEKEGTYVLARHFGYVERFDCIHWRGVFVSNSGSTFVWDFIEGNAEHIEGYWHFSPNVKLFKDTLLHENFELKIINLPSTSVSFNHNLKLPIGVTSDMYGSLRPSYSIKTKLSSYSESLTVFTDEEQLQSEFDDIATVFKKRMKKVKTSNESN